MLHFFDCCLSHLSLPLSLSLSSQPVQQRGRGNQKTRNSGKSESCLRLLLLRQPLLTPGRIKSMRERNVEPPVASLAPPSRVTFPLLFLGRQFLTPTCSSWRKKWGLERHFFLRLQTPWISSPRLTSRSREKHQLYLIISTQTIDNITTIVIWILAFGHLSSSIQDIHSQCFLQRCFMRNIATSTSLWHLNHVFVMNESPHSTWLHHETCTPHTSCCDASHAIIILGDPDSLICCYLQKYRVIFVILHCKKTFKLCNGKQGWGVDSASFSENKKKERDGV